MLTYACIALDHLLAAGKVTWNGDRYIEEVVRNSGSLFFPLSSTVCLTKPYVNVTFINRVDYKMNLLTANLW